MFSDVCAAGQMAADEGTGCKDCPADTYKEDDGREECTPCPEGTSTEGATGSDEVTDCLGKKNKTQGQITKCIGM